MGFDTSSMQSLLQKTDAMARHLVNRRFVIVLLCGLTGCSDPVDKAAKKRIFSPEDPPQAVASAAEKLPPEEVADSVRISRRVLGMRAGEATERIGPHKYAATISWEWTSATAAVKSVRLKENRELLAGKGGVSGDFSAKLSNTDEQGVEVIRVGGQVYARSTYGSAGAARFRQRLRDRGMAERIRDEAFGGMRDFDQMFRGRLKLSAQGTATIEGRTAWKYTVSLAPAEGEDESKLPAVVKPRNGVDETTKRRQMFYDLRQPKSLQGEVLVDAQTSVVLKARLDGRIGVTSEKGEADLRLVLDSSMTELGREPAISAPADALPDEDKPSGIAAALERFGVERTDAGVSLNGPIVPGGSSPAPLEPAADEAADEDDGPPAAPDPVEVVKPAAAPSTRPKPPSSVSTKHVKKKPGH